MQNGPSLLAKISISMINYYLVADLVAHLLIQVL